MADDHPDGPDDSWSGFVIPTDVHAFRCLVAKTDGHVGEDGLAFLPQAFDGGERVPLTVHGRPIGDAVVTVCGDDVFADVRSGVGRSVLVGLTPVIGFLALRVHRKRKVWWVEEATVLEIALTTERNADSRIPRLGTAG